MKTKNNYLVRQLALPVFMVTLFLIAPKENFGQRIAYVDTEYILDLMPEYRSAQKQLDIMSEEWQKEMEKKLAEIEKMEKEYQAEQVLMTEDMRKKREAEIQAKKTELKEFRNKKFGYEGELFKKRQELIKPIEDKVYDAIQQVAKKSALDIIFAKGGELLMLYCNAKYDKSDEVLAELGISVTKNKGGGDSSSPIQSPAPSRGK